MSTNLDYVTSKLNYVSPEETRPAYYLYRVDRDKVRPLPKKLSCEMRIHDSRPIADQISLDVQGFALGRHNTDFSEYYDEAAIKRDYYPQIAALVQKQTGAARVEVIDHNVRNDALANQNSTAAARPVRFVHNDYTDKSGPQRVKDMLGEAAAEPLLRHRFAVINVWRPITGPLVDMPLAVLDARSMAPEDFVETDLKYQDRTGEVYSIRHNPAHQWHYFANMQADEVLFLKCYDSALNGPARYTAHSAFADPTTPSDAPPRQSIEARSLVFFAPEA